MEVDHFTNGVSDSFSNGFLNGSTKHAAETPDCDADMGQYHPSFIKPDAVVSSSTSYCYVLMCAEHIE